MVTRYMRITQSVLRKFFDVSNMRATQIFLSVMKSPLRAERERRGLTLKAVALAVSMDQGNLSRVERGEQIPSKSAIEALCRFFGGAVTELQIIFPERYATATDDS